MAGKDSGSPFWRFSLAFYRREGVATASLTLQDHCGVDVNLLLFLLWLAQSCRCVAADDIAALDARLGRWRSEVVVPLRSMRRMLKADAPLLAPPQADAFRDGVKALELEAERLQQEAMFAAAATLRAQPATSREEAARANVGAYQYVKGCAFDRDALDTLLAEFARL